MKKEIILADCIDEIRAGWCTLEDCIAKYPGLADELRSLNNIHQLLKPSQATASPEFKERTLNRLQAIMDRDDQLVKSPWYSFSWLKLRFVRSSHFVLLSGLLSVAVSGGAVLASQYSGPQDVLYPLKLEIEDLQVMLPASPEVKVERYLALVDKRINEISRYNAIDEGTPTGVLDAIPAYLDKASQLTATVSSENDSSFLSKISTIYTQQESKLVQISELNPEFKPDYETTIGALRQNRIITKIAINNPAVLTAPSTVSGESDRSYFQISGTVQTVEESKWKVGGIELENVDARTKPSPNTSVTVEGIKYKDNFYIGEVKEAKTDEKPSEDKVTIGGRFKGTSKDGSTWDVSGIPVNNAQNVTPPSLGNQIEMKGTVKDGKLEINEVRSYNDKKKETSKDSSSSDKKTGNPAPAPANNQRRGKD